MPINDANDPEGPDLGGLYNEREPPAELEERVVRALRVETGRGGPGAVQPDPGGRERGGGLGGTRQPRWALIAAGLVLFIAGSLVGRATIRPSDVVAPTTGQPFMLLLWEDDRFSAGSPEAVAAEYAAWAESVAQGGAPISGDELGPSRTVGPLGDGSGPAPDARIGGYFLVHAESAEAAGRLALQHPHVEYGGWIDVAPILHR